MDNYLEEDPEEITPDFFSDIHKSEFVSVPIKIKHDDEHFDQTSSFIDYNENLFKSAQDRQRDFIFKYEDVNPKIVDEEAK
jgi:glycosylphosphatidylinositol transamidase (GPIT) subunit GPI8